LNFKARKISEKKKLDTNNNKRSYHRIVHIFCGNQKEALFPPVPSSEPIAAPKRIPTSEPILNSEKIPSFQQTKWNPHRPGNYNEGAYQQTTRIYGQFLAC
jgi:hypothetical protein